MYRAADVKAQVLSLSLSISFGRFSPPPPPRKIARNLNHSPLLGESVIKYTTFLHIASNLFYIYLQDAFFFIFDRRNF